MKLVPLVLLLVFLTCLLVGCHEDSDPVTGPTGPSIADAVREEQGFVAVSGRSLPNTNVSVDYARLYLEPLDGDSIEMVVYAGDTVYSPVELCHRAYHFMGAYLKTDEWHFVERAEKYASKLLELSTVTADGSRFAGYRYVYRVHGREDLELAPPWHSGMAQGEMLCVLVRLHEFTGRQEYLERAREVFRSLTRLRTTDSGPWVARLDSLGYYWIEEFPHDTEPGMTLNGYIAGLYGVYDYYRVTGEADAAAVWEAALTTLKHYLPEFRRPGRNSFYCLGHDHIATDGYHLLHAGMMGHLYRLTGDEYFREMEALLLGDAAGRTGG